MAQSLHVYAAGGDVGGHQHAERAALESAQRGGSLRLGSVAVNALGLHSVLHQILHDPVGPVLGPGENQRLFYVTPLQHGGEQGGLELVRYRIDRLGDAGGGRGLSLQVYPGGVVQHLPSELHDGRRHGGAEEQRLPASGEAAQYPGYVRQEPHVEHPVSFVQHDVFDGVEPGVGVLEVIEQPSRSCDQNVRPPAEGGFLRAHSHTAEDGRSLDGRVTSQILEVGQDLRRQLTGGSEHEGPRGSPRPVHQPMQQRQEKGRGLSAAGHGGCQNVAAVHGRRDGVGLDGRGLYVTQLLDTADEGGV